MTSKELQHRLEFAVKAARAAGNLTLRYFRDANVMVERKADTSPVTVADRGAEKLLREQIAVQFPDDGILGEELGEVAGHSGYRWILDPIDGTKSFVSSVPLYSTLVGLEHQGESLLGVILIPALGECVYAARGGGAWYTHGQDPPRPAHVSRKSSLSDGLFVTSEAKTFCQIDRWDAFERLQSKAWLTRTWGDGYGYMMVATGRAEVMIDPKLHVWDCCALQPVIEESGGKFTDWSGRATIHGGNAIATNGLVHDEVLKLIATAK